MLPQPKFSLGEQVVVDFTASQHIGKIIGGTIVGNEWKYAVDLGSAQKSTVYSYVTESQIKMKFYKEAWQIVQYQRRAQKGSFTYRKGLLEPRKQCYKPIPLTECQNSNAY